MTNANANNLSQLKKCPSPCLLKFYSAFAIFCMGDRVWTFANAFFFEFLGGMRLVSADQFIESLAMVLLSTWVGNWLDRRSRRAGAFGVLIANNLGLALSATFLAISMLISSHVKSNSSLTNATYWLCLFVAIALSSFTKCAAEGERLAFTKDWIVVMAKNAIAANNIDDADYPSKMEESLSKRNATMVIIDQFASVLGPLLIGFVLSWFGHLFTCGLIVGWNVFSLISTRLLLASVYKNVPDLGVRADAQIEIKINVNLDDVTKSDNMPIPSAYSKEPKNAISRLAHAAFTQVHTYYRQTVFPAAFGLALLYATVLGFDGLTVSFGKAQGMGDDGIGAFRSVSSILGLLGAVSFAPTQKWIGLRRTGLLGLSAQHLCLWLCAISIWLPGSPFDPVAYFSQWNIGNWIQSQQQTPSASSFVPNANGTFEFDYGNGTHGQSIDAISDSSIGSPLSILAFFIGITLSRFGLWMADLSIIQLMQLHCPESERGTVFGVQNGISQLFSMVKDLLVMALPDPRTFGLLILFSIFCVGTGFVQYIHYLRKTRKRRTNSDKSTDNNEGPETAIKKEMNGSTGKEEANKVESAREDEVETKKSPDIN